MENEKNRFPEDLSPDELRKKLLLFYESSPLCIAVYRGILNADGNGFQDAEFIYVNKNYIKWSLHKKEDYLGKTFKNCFPTAIAENWFKGGYEACYLNKPSKGKYFSRRSSHWIKYYITPLQGIKDCFVFSFINEDGMSEELIQVTKRIRSNELVHSLLEVLYLSDGYKKSLEIFLKKLQPVFNADRYMVLTPGKNDTIIPEAILKNDDIANENYDFKFKRYSDLIPFFDRQIGDKDYIYYADTREFKDHSGVDYQGLMDFKIHNLLVMPIRDYSRYIEGYLFATNCNISDEYDIHTVITSVSYFLFFKISIHHNIENLNRLSFYDSLTGLLNRKGFNDEFFSYISNKPDEKCSFIIVDVDDFKFVNDLYGHYIGDCTLIDIAKKMQKVFGKDAIIGRSGGDEFCIVIKGASEKETVEKLKEFYKINFSFTEEGRKYTYTVSCGYTLYPELNKDISRVMIDADTALYSAKLKGRNNYQKYTKDLSILNRSSLGFALKDIAGNIPSGIAVIKNDEKATILYINEYTASLFGYKSAYDLKLESGGSFANLVEPDEFRKAMSAVKSEINDPNSGNIAKVIYRIKTKEGETKELFSSLHLVTSPIYGEVYYAVSAEFFKEK